MTKNEVKSKADSSKVKRVRKHQTGLPDGTMTVILLKMPDSELKDESGNEVDLLEVAYLLPETTSWEIATCGYHKMCNACNLFDEEQVKEAIDNHTEFKVIVKITYPTEMEKMIALTKGTEARKKISIRRA